ncbi:MULTISPECIES: FAD-dependent 5-carboxymethylaminomethyl-2-thiouridine(34) oxidoreductase MnmC [Pseudomonadati]|uniref:tRNA 5-methylaminomethyl-2-thiouridine biosynthesis bifunctional protein MnmC n=1 Tax=Shewanella aestuarii TaxID=1028752 RepID=A0ABT0L4L9_9GAMM|nr:FAD-dependent 5-carboxymethylaminomethyl-2-thiouridine(34) oxidoreductase MnmC [Shewanella aestuarii]MCL1118156.1 FAD-dependent 5-carboxymethylaminomethyl-2-thiouridine(34) oxidoreductase MnmC [Shewanella aestuarii]
MSKSTNLFIVNHYKQYLQQLLLTEKMVATNNLVHIGHIGLMQPEHLNDLICALTQQQNLSAPSATRFHISLFTGHTQAQQSEFTHFVAKLIQTLTQFVKGIAVAPIEGCQRLDLQNNITIDCYFGSPIEQLKAIANHRHTVQHWFVASSTLQPILRDHFYSSAAMWQLGRLSSDNAALSIYDIDQQAVQPLANELKAIIKHSGFQLLEQHQTHSNVVDVIACQERQTLRNQQQANYAYQGLLTPPLIADTIGIIGGGIASASLALSLALRGRDVVLYCQDDMLAQGASGNRQGAIYPLLTPENNALSQFYQHAFLYSRQRVQRLISQGFTTSHDFCGVLHTGFDDRTKARLTKIIDGQSWPCDIAQPVSQAQASQIAGVDINQNGLFYPLGGWICPHEFAKASLELAATLSNITLKLNCKIKQIIKGEQGWELYTQQNANAIAQHKQLVLANGETLTQFTQTDQIPLSGFRGQVSHVPSQGQLAQLKTVICANGYLTPAHEQLHCVGASYVKTSENLAFCPKEQYENGQKMRQSFANADWPQDIDISENDARVGVRMVSRDHFPVMGFATDMETLNQRYQVQLTSNDKPSLWQRYWQNTSAPIHDGLLVLGGFGSRGLSSAPLVAECLAANLCGEVMPINLETQTLLSPNRMWMRKLLKGKAI